MRGTVLFIKENERGFWGRIRNDAGTLFYFDTSCLQSNFEVSPNMLVNFDVKKQSRNIDKAINVSPVVTKVLSYEQKASVVNFLVEMIEKDGFIDCRELPTLLLDQFKIDCMEYSQSLSDFVSTYLFEHFYIKTKQTIGNEVYPIVLLPIESEQGQKIPNVPLSGNQAKCKDHENLSLLDELYASERFSEFLSSPVFTKVAPCNLPLAYFAMALNCANRLLFPESNEEVILNDFQKELLTTPLAESLVKKWKVGGVFSPDIIEQCADSMYAHIYSQRNTKNVVDMLNNVGRSNAKNDNYVGISQRFASCANALTPHFYLIRLFAQQGKAALERCINDYCQFVKYVNIDYVPENNNLAATLVLLPELLKNARKYIFKDNAISRSSKTIIFSTYLDTGNTAELPSILPIICQNADAVEYKLFDLMHNGHMWAENDFIRLVQDQTNLQLIQKSIARLWDKQNDPTLPVEFLRLLAWVIKYNEYTSVDEIVKLEQIGNKTALDKQTALLEAFDVICEDASSDYDMYTLASYVALVICPDVSSTDTFALATDVQEKWHVFSEKFFKEVTVPESSISAENQESLLALFPVFMLDISHEREIQNRYADWFIGNIPASERTDDWMETAFDLLYRHFAYEAYIRLFNICIFEENPLSYSPRRITEYAESLIVLRRYTELVSFLVPNKNIPKDNKHNLLVRAIVENFQKNALAPSAFAMFNGTFSCEDAVTLLWEGIGANQYSVFTSLIALYCHLQEYNKAIYLYAIYRSKAEIGYSRLYGQFRKKLSPHIDSIRNRYDAIELALNTLTVRDITQFLRWIQGVPLPDIRGQEHVHALQFFYDNLVRNPLKDSTWKAFTTNLAKYIDKNAWHVFVGQRVLDELFSCQPNTADTKNVLEIISRERDAKKLPLNFLPCMFSYIINSNDRYAIMLLLEMVKTDDFIDRLFASNPWHRKYTDTTARFKAFCMHKYSETTDMSFYDLLTALGLPLDVSEMKQISQNDVDKQYLIVQICKNYLSSKDADKMIDLLNNGEWKHLSASEESVLELLRILYIDTSVLLSEQCELFPDAESVYRFKQDCAYILSVYPHKTALLRFNNECNNLAHKFRVYAYIFKVLYDEDIYESYELTYDDITDSETLYALLEFTNTAHLAQLKHNASFDFLYKRFRYLKLYLNLVLRKGIDADDSFITDAMEKYRHYDAVHQKWYVPMKEDVHKFLTLSCLASKEKETFLFCLIRGNFSDFLWKHADCLAKLNDDQRQLTRRMIGRLDFRRANHHLFRFYKDSILANNFGSLLPAAKAFSVFATDAVLQLQNANNPDAAGKALCKMLNTKEPAKVLDRVMRESDQSFAENQDIFVPWYCASQYAFRILAKWRAYVIRNTGSLSERHLVIAQYLANRGEEDARNTYNYLRALECCIKKDRIQAASIVDAQDITVGIPEYWKKEAERIREYAHGNIDIFEPDGAIIDSSSEVERNVAANKFTFILRLQKYCNSRDDEPKPDTVITSYEKYVASRETDGEKFSLGLYTLKNYNILEKMYQKKPRSFAELVLEVGLLAVSANNGLSQDEQAEVAAELVFHRHEFKKQELKQNLFDLTERFRELLHRKLSLSTWVRIAETAELFLSDTNDREAFSELHEKVLKLCGRALSSHCPLDKRYMELEKLRLSIETIRNCFCSRNVREAISTELANLEKGIRLEIKIDSNYATDGYVYFHIKNVGKTTVSLKKDGRDKLSVLLQEGPYTEKVVPIDAINSLHSDYLTGACVKLVTIDQQSDISVTLKIVQETDDGEVVICQDSQLVHRSNCYEGIHVDAVHETYEVQNAIGVNQKELLKGRESVQAKIRTAISKGTTVIYGPSRIGKTSLLNWVKFIAQGQGNVITLLYGGERWRRKTIEWEKSFLTGKEDIPYNDPTGMSRYLLADTILHGLGERQHYTGPAHASPELFEKIRTIITDDRQYNNRLLDRYYDLDLLLQEHNLQIWILLDEFQKVVQRWNGLEYGTEFEQICSVLSNKRSEDYISNIKLIVCGSDDLLRHMVLDHTSIWKDIFKGATSIPIEPLDVEPFEDMIRTDPALAGTNIHYDTSAQRALYKYTGGVAMYGKMVCNAILDDIAANPGQYACRDWLYVSDVAKATQLLLKKQSDEMKMSDQQTISEIYKAVTQNLEEGTMYYLWYMARWLETHPKCDSFDLALFESKLLREMDISLSDAIEIAKARGIIRNKSRDQEHQYVFRTLFYYFAFIGSAPSMEKLNKIIFLEGGHAQQEAEPDRVMIDPVRLLKNNFMELIDSDKEDAIHTLYGCWKDDDAKQRFRNSFGNQQFGDTVQGNKIGTQNNIQVNIQQITSTLQAFNLGRLTDSELLQQVNSMPRLDAFYTPNEELAKTNPALEEQRREYGISAVTDIYTGSALSVIDQVIDEELSDYEQFHVQELLGIDEEAFAKICNTMDDWAYEHLRLTLYLHHFFMNAQKDSEYVDCSPVTIMYCKLLESLLKEKHKKVYARVFKDIKSNVGRKDKKTNATVYLTYYELLTGNMPERITIGTFTHLLKSKANCRLLGEYCLDEYNEPTTRLWERHGKDANEVLDIRNQSAHGQKNLRISFQQQERLISLLFKDEGGELYRISALVANQ